MSSPIYQKQRRSLGSLNKYSLLSFPIGKASEDTVFSLLKLKYKVLSESYFLL